MMLILLSINMILSLIFMSLTHPLSMGLILLIQTITIALITGSFSYNFWFSYILFLILIGGMLILFMYMTSIASNEKFTFKISSLTMMTSMPIILLIPNMFMFMPMNNNEITEMNKMMMINQSLNKYINYPENMILTFMIMYLFLTLIATVKITNFKKGPLRPMN